MAARMGASSASSLSWLRQSKQVVMTSFLWSMHLAAVGYLQDETDQAGAYLQAAAKFMHTLWPARTKQLSEPAFVENWLALRREFFEFLVFFYRSFKPKQAYFNYVLGIGE